MFGIIKKILTKFKQDEFTQSPELSEKQSVHLAVNDIKTESQYEKLSNAEREFLIKHMSKRVENVSKPSVRDNKNTISSGSDNNTVTTNSIHNTNIQSVNNSTSSYDCSSSNDSSSSSYSSGGSCD